MNFIHKGALATINPMSLDKKIIVVTGASSGIGKEACILASQLGARIALVARNEDRLNETLNCLSGNGHKFYSFDLKNIEAINGLVDNIVSDFGKIDGLVYASGVTLSRSIKLSYHKIIHDVMLINFYGYAEMVRCFLLKKNINNGASIVGISSNAASNPQKGLQIYAASKAAMNSFSQSVAKEVGSRKIRVNTIEFGMINTIMYTGFLQDTSEDHFDSFWKDQYLGIGSTLDAANSICFMLSDASSFITGTAMSSNGGLH